MNNEAYGAESPKRNDYDGIDLSHHNGNIQWSKVKKHHSNIKFVYLKASEGWSHVDRKFHDNVESARAQGFKVGAYHFFNLSKEASVQFENFQLEIDNETLDLLPVVDFELLDEYAASVGRKKAIKVVDELVEFCRLVKKRYGRFPMLYTNEHLYNKYLASYKPKRCGDVLDKGFKALHLFIASYSGEPQLVDGAKYTIWQYSERGTLKGISEKVDLNKFHSSKNINSITFTKKRRK